MAKKEKKAKDPNKKSLRTRVLESDAYRVVLIILGSVISTAVLFLSIMAIMKLSENNLSASSNYLLGVFLVLGLSRLVTFIKEKTKISLMRFLVLLVFDVALGIIIYFGKHNPYLYSLCGGLYCLTIIISRVFKIIQKPQVRNIVLSAIIIIFAGILGIALFLPVTAEYVTAVILLICLIVAISAFIEVFSNAMSQLKFKVLFKIILKTYALEIILGLFTMMVASSLIFMLNEPNIPTFADGLWYSFAVVTTIGFGDFSAVTWIGRMMTCILGIYGILVVAVLTSIIVNFYNETAGKKDSEGIKEVKEDIEEDKIKKEKKK